MKRLFFLIFFLSNFSFAQNIQKFHRSYSDSMPAAYQINHSVLRETIFSKFPTEFRNAKKAKQCYVYADLLAMNFADEMESGLIYSDWNEFEDYLNAIVKKIVPKDLFEKESLHVYISKNGSINAYAAASGAIVFNIGLMPFMADESCIAAVLGHEIAHNYFNHVVTNYLNNIYGKFGYGLFNDTKAKNRNNVNNELQADSISMIWLNNAGYNIDGVIKAQQVLARYEKQQIRKIEGKFKLEETTHPTSDHRLKKTIEIKSKINLNDGKNFIINENAFELFKKESRYEVLNNFLESLDFTSCIEKAFLFHIFEPEDSIFHYYLIEGIRLYCYFDETRWSKNFITDNYYVNVDIDGHKKKNPMESSLLEKFDLEILPIDPNDGIKIKTKNYWRESPVFITYNEAFNYFCREGIKYNNPECILSNALSSANDTLKRNSWLNLYLSFSNIKHREYAKAFLKDSLFKSLGNKVLNIISDYHVDVIHGTVKTCLARAFKEKSGIIYKTAKNSLLNDSLITSIILDDLKYDKMNDYIILRRMELVFLSSQMLGNSYWDLSYIDPAFWEIFQKYSVRTIVFDKVTYTPAITRNNSFEELKNIIKPDPNDIWFNSFDIAYLNMVELMFTINKNKLIATVSASGDQKLLRNGDTQGQLQKLVLTKKGLY